MTVLEACTAALVTALDTGRPALVPAPERDRWVDVEVGPASASVLALAGFEDEPDENRISGVQDFVDFRRVKLLFEIWTSTTSGATAAVAMDTIIEWLGRTCGPVDAGPLATAGATRLRMGKKTVVVAKGNTMRGLVELVLEYRNLTNDLTRAK